jgi:hypothetical protein
MPSKKHAQLPPSSAERWKNCPGSVTLSKQFPQDTTSAYAEEGTHAHAVAELKLRYANDEINPDNFDRFSSKLDALKKSEYWCGEMDEATNYYRDAVLEIRDSAGEDAELLIEQHFNLDEYVPGGFGTSDAVVIGSGAINVIDLKYGKGIKVNAVGNSQLRLYGLGAAGLFEGIYDFDKVRMTIIQPRLDHISTEEISLEELRRWATEEIRPAAEEALSGSERTACGDWCQFCPAKAVCRTRAEYCLELARDEFKKPPLLTADEIETLARLVRLEAEGEPFTGQVAVAEVVLNRVVSKVFPNNVYDVVYQTYPSVQFTPASSIPYTAATQTQYDAVEAALRGPNILPMDVCYFATSQNGRTQAWGWIGNHCFCY